MTGDEESARLQEAMGRMGAVVEELHAVLWARLTAEVDYSTKCVTALVEALRDTEVPK